MMDATKLTAPCDTARQLSGKDPERTILAVIAKRTYDLHPDGSLTVAAEQVPIAGEPVDDEENRRLLLHDFDAYPHKPLTDVVVKGHAQGRGRRRFEVAVRAGEHEKRILVRGDRRCGVSGTGSPVFPEPEPVDTVPLRYSHAYGGLDVAAETKYGNPLKKILGKATSEESGNPDDASLFLYPRNFAGKGYVVEAERKALEGLELPNLEDPLDPLSPERLVVGDPFRWDRMPLPQATDWMSYAWFPRRAYFGAPPAARRPGEAPLEERRGLALPGLLDVREPTLEMGFRLMCGASLGLQIPHLTGGETIELEGIHASSETFAFKLPKRAPKLWIDARDGTLRQTKDVVIHTVVVEPDAGRVTVLWRGSGKAKRSYLPKELETMPFELEWRD